MNARLRDDEMYCPECGAPIKKGFYTCANCRFKVQLSRQMNMETEDASPQSPASIVEEVKKPSPPPVETIASRELTEELQDEKADEAEEIQEKEEVDGGQTPIKEETEEVEAEPQIPYKPLEKSQEEKYIEIKSVPGEKDPEDK